jgi:hypothetical protein
MCLQSLYWKCRLSGNIIYAASLNPEEEFHTAKLPRLGTTNADPVANHGKWDLIQRLHATMLIVKNLNITLLHYWMRTPSEQEVSRSLLILCKISLLATRGSKRSHSMI